jgi:hypothetical protein
MISSRIVLTRESKERFSSFSSLSKVKGVFRKIVEQEHKIAEGINSGGEQRKKTQRFSIGR